MAQRLRRPQHIIHGSNEGHIARRRARPYSSPALLTATAVLICLAVIVQPASASIGDRSYAYRACQSHCISSTCDAAPDAPADARPPPPWLWFCSADCGYACMHNLTDAAISPLLTFDEKLRLLPGLPPDRVVQFNGKWPFYRLGSVQEPLSVLFSLANLAMHVKYGLGMRAKLPDTLPAPLKRAYALVPLAGINLWIWSTVFHTRDTPATEKLDYFSAAASMMCNLYVAVVRLAGLYASASTRDTSALARKALAALLFAIFVCHTSYLTFWRFDYGYNMQFNIGIGILHNLLWSAWSLHHFRLPARALSASERRAPHYLRPVAVLTLLSSLTALELLDFPPLYRALDAHALWHLSTIPIVKMWYDCLLVDAWWLVGREAEYAESSRSQEKGLRTA